MEQASHKLHSISLNIVWWQYLAMERVKYILDCNDVPLMQSQGSRLDLRLVDSTSTYVEVLHVVLRVTSTYTCMAVVVLLSTK